MKRASIIIFFLIVCCLSAFGQDTDLQLARQYTTDGEPQKALGIYQKLFKQNNESYYPYYINCLLSLKKFDEAESVTKKMQRRHPADNQYPVTLGRIYTQRGDIDKADQVYDELIKNLAADPAEISSLASQFYQAQNADYAIKIFQRGRKLLNDNRLYSFELINLYRFKRDKPDLVEEYLNFLPENPSFMNQAENALSGIFEGPADYDMFKAALYKHIQKAPQQTVYADLLTWQFLQ
ncbi:MAG: hypothetical protein JST32_19435, partial [Bacteroidetes bacterium]|nr:hypothetical protein [Bacteroidota bacterium]